MADGSQEQAACRAAVMECEQEIQSIKAALRQLSAVDSGDPNSLEIVLLKAEGLPAGAKPEVSLQLSSPIEEATLTKIFDPANDDASSESKAVFQGVETSTAMLTVSASDAEIPLGASAPHDLAPLCTINAMDMKEKYEAEVSIAILSSEEQTENLAKVESVESTETEKTGNFEEAEKTEGTSKDAVLIQPICTITLRMTYKPSPKDQREELYELLNKTSQRKAAALENLRKISMTIARAGAEPSAAAGTLSKPSVKPGFLNKKKVEPTKMEKFYQRTFGPNSMLRKGVGLLVFAKDYVMFLGAVSFFHFKGQVLALPAPV